MGVLSEWRRQLFCRGEGSHSLTTELIEEGESVQPGVDRVYLVAGGFQSGYPDYFP